MDPLALSSPITSPRRCRRHQEARPIPTLARAAATCTYSRHARGRVRPRVDAHGCVITPGLSEADIQAVEDRYGLETTGTVRSVPVLHLVQAAGSNPTGGPAFRRPHGVLVEPGEPALRAGVEARRVAHRDALDEVADVAGRSTWATRGPLRVVGGAAGQGPTALRSELAEPTPQPLPGDRRAHLQDQGPLGDRAPIDEKTLINRSVTEPTAPPRRRRRRRARPVHSGPRSPSRLRETPVDALVSRPPRPKARSRPASSRARRPRRTPRA